MERYESKINVNGEWRTLLVVKSDEVQTFGTHINFIDGNVTTIYAVGEALKHVVEDNVHIYWFLPTDKQTVTAEIDSELRDIINTILGVNGDE